MPGTSTQDGISVSFSFQVKADDRELNGLGMWLYTRMQLVPRVGDDVFLPTPQLWIDGGDCLDGTCRSVIWYCGGIPHANVMLEPIRLEKETIDELIGIGYQLDGNPKNQLRPEDKQDQAWESLSGFFEDRPRIEETRLDLIQANLGQANAMLESLYRKSESNEKFAELIKHIREEIQQTRRLCTPEGLHESAALIDTLAGLKKADEDEQNTEGSEKRPDAPILAPARSQQAPERFQQ